jgi:cytochrome c556
LRLRKRNREFRQEERALPPKAGIAILSCDVNVVWRTRMKLLKSMAVIGSIIVGATAVYAQNADAIKQRRDVMRTIAKAGSDPFKMTKGEAPFDLAAVQAVLKAVEDNAPKFKAMFPDDSKTGSTEATAKVWEARAEFNGVIDKWVADAKAAAALIKDEASFKVEYPKVASSCGGCHGNRGGFAPGLGDSFKRMQTPL